MSCLYIIGNGFDIAHDLKTSYRYFRRYLWWCFTGKVYEEDGNEDPPMIAMPVLARPYIHDLTVVFNNQVFHEGQDDKENLKEKAKCLYWLIDSAALKAKKYPQVSDLKSTSKNLGVIIASEWNKLEELIGTLDYTDFFGDEPMDSGHLSMLSELINSLLSFFSDWIHEDDLDWTKANGIDYGSARYEYGDELREHFNQDDALFITFNYTYTVEYLYKVSQENVYHIHGMQALKSDIKKQIKHTCYGDRSTSAYPKIVFGCDEQALDDANKLRLYKENNTKQWIMSYNDVLRKETSEIVEAMKKSAFYNKLVHESKDAGIREVYVFGFSFGKVDKPQILEICKVLYRDCKNASDITWYLHTHGDTKQGSEDRTTNEKTEVMIKEIVSQIDGIMGEPVFARWL